jgi:hypothetical protein
VGDDKYKIIQMDSLKGAQYVADKRVDRGIILKLICKEQCEAM